MSAVAQARASADLEAVRIAQAYSADPLLKHLSVPRVRLPEVTVDLPMLITDIGVGDGKSMGWAMEKPTRTEVNKAVRVALTESKLRLPVAEGDAVVAAAVDEVSAAFAEGDPTLLTPEDVARRASEAAVTKAAETKKGASLGPELMGFPKLAASSLHELLRRKRVPMPAVNVVVQSAAIKEQANTANVVHIRLNITEDAFEITEEPDGPGFRLTPE
ncbi:hypothetical protein [Kribbia dieselivorans]|uniref:hypothetical protein n=1 Tax=Kribbia dieselivorans TaxID=331526 RepID=UPI0012EEB87E|nr:hypothetical protein [Kribbia dieselivorans]